MNSKLHASKRTYYFNHYDNENKSDIIEIIESKVDKNGKEVQRILIFKEDVAAFRLEFEQFLSKNQ